MSARLLDGRAVARQILKETGKKVAAFEQEWGFRPTLALVRAGEDPASVNYARTIRRTCEGRGIGFQVHSLPAKAREGEWAARVQELSADAGVHGIIIHHPDAARQRPTVGLRCDPKPAQAGDQR